MIPAGLTLGPWARGLDPVERLARLRSLRAIVRAYLGPRGQALADWLHHAETDETALAPALDALDHLAALDRRRVLSSFAALARPAA